LKEGTKVVAFVHGGKFDDRGSFAEYAKVRGDFAIVLPEDAEEKGYGKQGGLEGGSSLGIPFCTAAMVGSLTSYGSIADSSVSSTTRVRSTPLPRSPTVNG
jgi:NADPH:quinone reductase-like Zn-dependent oxidoreductase